MPTVVDSNVYSLLVRLMVEIASPCMQPLESLLVKFRRHITGSLRDR